MSGVGVAQGIAACAVARSGFLRFRRPGYPSRMCRNIHTLHNFEPAASDDEVHAAALQFVRKISGSPQPSKANTAAFDRAVIEISSITRQLLDDLVTNAPPKDREEEIAKLRKRSRQRFATVG